MVTKSIIFDYDGTVIDSSKIKENAFGELYSFYGISIKNKVVKYHLKNEGISRFDKFKHFQEFILKKKYNDKIGKELSNRFSKIIFKKILHAKFVDGALNFLKNNSKNFDFYIASATPHDELIKITNYQKIDQYFKKIYGYPPDKKTIIKTIIKENNYKASEVMMLGDAISDFEAAKINKIRFIGINKNNNIIFPPNTIKIDHFNKLENYII